MNQTLEEALAFTLGNEGGFSNHPADSGGVTNFGIIQRNLNKWNGIHPELGFPTDVKNLTRTQAETIYRVDYWRWDGISNATIAIKLFDIGVNCGTGTAIKLLQKAVNLLANPPITVDGLLGPATLSVVNAQPVDIMLKAICQTQRDYYQALVANDSSQAAFLKGWLNRAARLPEVPHGV